MFKYSKKFWMLAVAISIILLSLPAKAIQLRIDPQTPQLGDTISVSIEVNDPNSQPKVLFEGKSYPSFATENSNLYRALLPTSPLYRSGKLNLQVEADGERKNIALWLKNRSFAIQRIRLSGKASQSATQMELDRVSQFKALVTPQKYWDGLFLRPNVGRISSEYGVRRYYNGVFAKDYYHRGVDYAGGYGSPVIAPAAGKVALVGKEAEGFRVHGNVVGIDHGQGVTSIFLHLSKIDVREGDFVTAGQQIGAIGDTGAAAGPHLHWGLYVHGISVDPLPWRISGIN